MPPGFDPPFDHLAGRYRLLGPGDPGYTAYTGDIVLEGHPDAVARPESATEVGELLAEAAAAGVPVTAAGGQTSLTGSSVAENGLLLSFEKLDRLLDIGRDPGTGAMVARAEPGIFLGDFQRQLAAEGWLYPPDPTSRNEARLGATVATNATGEDTLQYGPTRRWIRELEFRRADGSTGVLRRPPGHRPPEEKATAGYYPAEHPIDHLIGSEGTLAFLTRITVDLVPDPPGVFSGVAFFPDLAAALGFVVAARESNRVRPRALELIDRAALDLARENPEGIRWPEATGAAILFKQEVQDAPDRDRRMEAWFDLLRDHLPGETGAGLLDRVLLLEESGDREQLRRFRHRIPAALNERIDRVRTRGGGKVGTDWWVPYRELPDFLEGWGERLEASGIPWVVFGHVGNGHPHINLLPADRGELEGARALARTMAVEAVARGGGVAGEHGLGKLKRDLLGIQYPPERIAAMRDIKKTWDPRGILGRGNIFPPETTSPARKTETS